MEDDRLFQLQNTRTLSYFSVLPHSKNMPTMEKFMALPGDKVRERRKHKWADLPEEELAKRFGD